MNKSKDKGNRFERFLVKLIESFYIRARRAWGSNGQALGMHEEVDVLMDEEIRIQAKCRKSLPKYLGMTEEVDMVAFKEDRGETYFLVRASDFLKCYKEYKDRMIADSGTKSFTLTIVVDDGKWILAGGNHTLESAIQAKMKNIDVVFIYEELSIEELYAPVNCASSSYPWKVP